MSCSQVAQNGQEAPRRAGRRGWARSDIFRVPLDPDVGTEMESPGHRSGRVATLNDSQSSCSWSTLSGCSASTSWEDVSDHGDKSPTRGQPSGEHLGDAQRPVAGAREQGSDEGSTALCSLASELHGLSFPGSKEDSSESCPPCGARATLLASSTGQLQGGLEEMQEVRTTGSRDTSAHPRLSSGSASWSPDPGWPKNMAPPPSIQDEETFEIIDNFPETSCDARDQSGGDKGELTHGTGLALKGSPAEVDPEGETADGTEDTPLGSHGGTGNSLGRSSTVACHSVSPLWPGQNPDRGQSRCSVPEPDVDPDASTVDEQGQLLDLMGQRDHPGLCAPRQPCASGTGLPPVPRSHEDCETTEERNMPEDVLNCSHNSSSSSASWWNSPMFSSGSSEAGSPWSYLNSSGSSFVSLAGSMRQETLEARTLQPNDLERLLAGVTHEWLFQRLEHTGVFKPSQLLRAYGECGSLGQVQLGGTSVLGTVEELVFIP